LTAVDVNFDDFPEYSLSQTDGRRCHADSIENSLIWSKTEKKIVQLLLVNIDSIESDPLKMAKEKKEERIALEWSLS